MFPIPVQNGQPFRQTVEGIVAADGTLTLTSDEVPSSHLWAVFHIEVFEEDHDAGPVTIRVGRLGVERQIYTAATLATASLLNFSDVHYMTEREHIVVELAGGTSGDKVTVTFNGVGGFYGDQSAPVLVT